MIALKVAGGYLDLNPGTISVEISNPYFNFDAVPGTTSYPFALPGTATNLRLLGFPHVRAGQGEQPAPEPAEFYVDGLLWRVGSLLYREFEAGKRQLSYQFAADAADLQRRTEGLSLPDLNLGELPLELRPDAADYALPPVRNSRFFGDKNQLFRRYLNYYDGAGSYSAPGGAPGQPFVTSALTPFPRLLPLLRRVLATVGYTLTGPWAADAEIGQLVLYSDRALAAAATTLALARHVPAVGVGALLVALQKLFALGYTFDSQRRELHIRPLRAVIADQAYRDRQPAGPARSPASDEAGFTLKMELPDDEQNKTLPTAWAELRVRGGKERVETSAGTLHALREGDTILTSRQWLVPTLEAQGASPDFELGDESKTGLLLLFDRGLQPDSQGTPYPLATWGSQNYAGQDVGQYELRWAGPRGLYAQWHQPWLDFLRTATSQERLMQFGVADLLALDPARKEMVEGRKYLWEKVSLSLSTTKRLETARFTYRYVKL